MPFKIGDIVECNPDGSELIKDYFKMNNLSNIGTIHSFHTPYSWYVDFGDPCPRFYIYSKNMKLAKQTLLNKLSRYLNSI